MMTKEILKPNYMHNWLTSCLEAHDRGLFFLSAERGMGKTAFTKAIDDLDTCKYKGEKSRLPKTITRVWHFNTREASRIDSFKSGLADMLKYLRELGERGEVIEVAKFSAEMDTRVSEFTSYWETNLAKQQQKTSDFLGYIKKAYQTKRQFEKLLIVLDGLDEIKNLADVEKGTDGNYTKEYQEKYGKFSIFDFIPTPEMLPEGVYILITSRTDREVAGNRSVEERIHKLKLTEALAIERKNGQYIDTLKHYIKSEIFKSKNVKTEALTELLEKPEYRFIYASAYNKLYLLLWQQKKSEDHTEIRENTAYLSAPTLRALRIKMAVMCYLI